MSLIRNRLTYEEYLKSPEIRQRYEIVDGDMLMPPAPSLEHQTILRQIFRLLDQYVVEHQLGEVWFAPLDIVIQREPLRTRQPDLLFVSQERASNLGPVMEVAPDLLVEILSPSNTRASLEEKLGDYLRLGVRECWLVSPEARTIEVLKARVGRWERMGLHGLGDAVASEVLTGLQISANQVFK